MTTHLSTGRPRHTVPTHLKVPDKVLFGLTARQLLILLVGCCLAYNLWFQLDPLAVTGTFGQIVRLLLIAFPLGGALAFSLIEIADRPLERWLWIALRYWRQPKIYVWRSRRLQQEDADPHADEHDDLLCVQGEADQQEQEVRI